MNKLCTKFQVKILSFDLIPQQKTETTSKAQNIGIMRFRELYIPYIIEVESQSFER